MVQPLRFRRKRRRWPRPNLSSLRVWILLAVLLALWFGLREAGLVGERFDAPLRVTEQFPLCSSPGYTANCVVDGDTIRIGERRIRLTGFDAAELEGACQRESDLAIAARNELHRWLALGPFELSGGAQPPRDQYGRELRAARRVGADGDVDMLADIMVAKGLAGTGGWSVGGDAWC
ncbi:MAG: hypothetical protein WBA68_10975 [Alteraurantiacibacter sp.]